MSVKLNYRVMFVVLALATGLGCGSGDGDENPETSVFDQTAMLNNWADDIIVPGYERYFTELFDLQEAMTSFLNNPGTGSLNVLRAAFRNAYVDWQAVSMFEVGPAEKVSLRAFTNTFPTDVSNIEANVIDGFTDLSQESTQDEQGFPALDYLLYGVAADDAAIVAKLSESAYQGYLASLVNRLYNLTNEVLSTWRGGYRQQFVTNSNPEGGSMTNKLANLFLNYMEETVNNSKLGRPAGAIGSPRAELAEAPYAGDLSTQLLIQSISSASGFFRGQSANGTSLGESFSRYLDASNVFLSNTQLSAVINFQFSFALENIQRYNVDIKTQVETDADLVVEGHNRLKELVRLIRENMFRGLDLVEE